MFWSKLLFEIYVCNVNHFYVSASKYSPQSDFENFITQVTKANFEKKGKSFPFTFNISNWKIWLSTREKVFLKKY